MGHGIGRNKEASLPYAAFLHQAGYNVLLFDHRNHGGSSTDWWFHPMSQRFTDDIAAVADFVRSHPDLANGQMVLYTFSFSTFPSLYILYRPEYQFQAIICDSGPARNIWSLYDRFADANRLVMPAIFKGPMLYRVVKAVYPLVGGAMLAVEQWPPRLDNLPVQLLFIANEKDLLIPANEVKQVAAMYPQAQFWVAPKTGHLRALRTHEATYQELVTAFLQEALAPQGESAYVMQP